MTIFHRMPGHLIRRLNQIAVSIFQDRMQGLGLDLTPVQFAALDALSDNPGIDQATLAGMIAHDRVTIGGVVDRLQTKGLVTRSVNEKDRRSRRLVLTEAGEAMLARIVPVVSDLQDEILCGLSDDERAAFIALASKAAEAGNDRSRAPLKIRA
ncbi:MarR family winged helix-turn-helix transcriptional regulator [Pararhodobacter marinus]|nr:MarR family transcriptional regulator [Pararhodobacter marinus]